MTVHLRDVPGVITKVAHIDDAPPSRLYLGLENLLFGRLGIVGGEVSESGRVETYYRRGEPLLRTWIADLVLGRKVRPLSEGQRERFRTERYGSPKYGGLTRCWRWRVHQICLTVEKHQDGWPRVVFGWAKQL